MIGGSPRLIICNKENFQMMPAKRIDSRRRAPQFVYFNIMLFRSSFGEVLLRCLSHTKATYTMSEAHSGVFGAHQSGAKLHFQIKRMGYDWATMVKDCMDYAQSCQPCQFHANFICQPQESLHPTTASWQFDA
ncbi:hypothetical protein LIER_18387 [Lithospermum erythrorhizon]|uniref:Integrase zinc-binding domain-containing protein n=1 Tax=Lithospermum erythrorhizon TaxID=34254 RepID=A0AAV3QI98_LITER